jgi:hypothetical protein
MKRKRRTVPSRRPLYLETLEDRTLLTGNVTVSLGLDGTLSILGDAGNDSVQILDSSPPGLPNLTVRVQGAPGSFTAINGVQYLDFAANAIQSIKATFLNGKNSLQIIGPLPLNNTIPGQVTVTTGTGSNSLIMSNVTANAISFVGNNNTGSDTISLTSVKAGQLVAVTGTGADTFNLTGSNIAIASLTTDAGNDQVIIAGSTIGSLTSVSGAGNDVYNVTGNSLSKVAISVGTGAGTGDDTVTFSNNTILNSATLTIGTGGTATPTASNPGHQVNINNNTLTLGDLTATVGNSTFLANTSGSKFALTQVTMNGNKVAGKESLTVGDWALNVNANGNTASRLAVVVGNNSGEVLNNGGSNPLAPPSVGGVTVSSNTVAQQLAVTVGTPTAGAGVIDNVSLDRNVAGTLAVTVLDGTNNLFGSGTLADEKVSITNTVLTAAGNVPNTISVGFNPSGNVGLTSRNTTVSNLSSKAAPVLLQISAGQLGGVGSSTNFGSPPAGERNGGSIVLNGIITDELDVFVGNNFSSVALTNSSTLPDANGAGNLGLTLGTNNAAGLSISLLNDSIGNGAQGTLNLFKTDNPTDLTQWAIGAIKAFDMNMFGGVGSNVVILSNIAVTDAMFITAGSGATSINDVSAHKVTAFYGVVDGGPGPANVYQDAGGNSGFVTFDFTGYITGADPLALNPSDLSVSAATVNEGDTVTLTGSFSQNNNIDPHTVTIHWGDGSPDTVLTLESGVFDFTVTHQFLNINTGTGPLLAGSSGGSASTGQILVSVTDSDNKTVSAGVAVTVNNVAPIIPADGLTLSSSTINEGDTLTLAGAFTDPGLMESHQVVIDWGDGSPTTTLPLGAGVLTFSAKHQYLDNLPGNAPYAIHVVLTDANGGSTSADTQVVVQDVAPASLQLGFGSTTLNEGDTATLNGSFTDSGTQDAHTVVIDWGDGSAATTLKLGPGVLTFSATHPYLNNLPGNAPYAIQVSVSDPDKGSVSSSTSLTVQNVAPTAQAGPDQFVMEGAPVTLNGSFVDPGTQDGHTFSWTVTASDGQTVATGSGPSFTFTPNQLGVYTVSLTVTDSDGGVGTSTATVTVLSGVHSQGSGIVSAGPAQVITTGSSVTLNAMFSDPSIAAGSTIQWSAAAASGQVVATGSGPSFTFTPSQSGTYTVTLSVTESNGITATSTTTVTATTPDLVSITGTVFMDLNADGVQNAGEAGKAGVSVFLDLNGNGLFDTGEPTTTTDTNGSYSFLNLAAGSYTVRLNLSSPNLQLSNPAASAHTIATAGVSSGIDFGLQPNNVIFPIHANADLFSPHPNEDANMAYVKGLYHTVLGRDADTAGVSFWVHALAGGMAREDVAWGFINSTEHRQQQVNAYYSTFLGRSASDEASQYWVNLLQATGDESAVIRGILTSPEYLAQHASDQSFVSDLYRNLLGRTGSAAELQFWTQQLAGGMSRAAVVDGFLHSREEAQLAVDSYYAAFLHRSGDPLQEAWITQVMGGALSFGQAAKGFLAAPEFLQSADQHVP